MTEYVYNQTFIETRQEIQEDGSLGRPVLIRSFSKVLDGNKKEYTKRNDKKVIAKKKEDKKGKLASGGAKWLWLWQCRPDFKKDLTSTNDEQQKAEEDSEGHNNSEEAGGDDEGDYSRAGEPERLENAWFTYFSEELGADLRDHIR